MTREIFNELSGFTEFYTFEKELNKTNNGAFFLYRKDNNFVVIKELNKIKDEEGVLEIDKELFSYERLKALEIATPKLLGYNKQENIVLKEYIEGDDVLELIKDDKLKKELYIELLKYSELLNSDNLNIDYFPVNFVLKGSELFYINYKVFPYTEELNLRNWGIFYWINNEGIKRYLDTGDEYFINNKGEKMPVITDFLKNKRDDIYREYVIWKHEI